MRSSRVAVPIFPECPTQHPSFSSQCLRCGLPAPRALPQRSSTPASHKRSSAPLGGILRPIRRCRCPLSAASSGVTEGLWVTLAFLGTCASVHALKLGFLHWISPRFSTLLLARHDLSRGACRTGGTLVLLRIAFFCCVPKPRTGQDRSPLLGLNSPAQRL